MGARALAIREASSEDLDGVVAILEEAARWLLRRGIVQWPVPFPSELVARDIANRRVWLAETDRAPVGTVTVLDRDPMFWGDQSVPAWYVHRLAVRRSAAGSGAEILSWVERAAVANGIGFVRLDCGEGLRAYYEHAGYILQWEMSLLGAMSVPARSRWSCYQKALAVPTSPRSPTQQPSVVSPELGALPSMQPDTVDEQDKVALERVRRICLRFEGVEEGTLQDRPLFRVGRRRFAIVNASGSPPRPRWSASGRSLHFLADPLERDALRQDRRFVASPHHGDRGWMALRLDEGDVDWGEVAELLESAYRQVVPRSSRPG
jgi:predicted DNA-binding protein (MmcQ/YjbR family)